MAEQDLPQIYLITPTEFELSRFSGELAGVLDAHEVACVRLAMSSADEDALSRAADALREITDARDVALVVEKHILLAERMGLDGVHLTDGARSVSKARKSLGDDAIVGAYCEASRHTGMSAGEAGADYVSFGPLGETTLGDGSTVDLELFEWWSQMIEVPVVAEGMLNSDLVKQVAPFTDFFGFGNEIWSQDEPSKALAGFKALMV
ncbi:thiamine phosphate synthase [Lentibacter algarum]|uniref:thiamine phosphate synthase n=1 Tax=Lentibacter algarum TaxID=576131 RepID=UPI001C08D9A5|nr:thiamine phosphate synthase [Lentibacter algarum]MBU2982396.1 thiamine phosphate synthase [Lentibacter algarum]